MDTKQAEYEGAIERLRGDTSAALERLQADMNKRDKENTRWIIAVVVAAVIVIIGAVGLLN